MKKFVAFIAVALILCGAIKLATRPYEIGGEVVEDRGSIVVVELDNGCIHEVKVKAFSFREGERVVATVKEKGATTPRDDEIIDLRLV